MRTGVAVAIAASIIIHTGLLYALVLVRLDRRAPLTDAPAPESVLSLAPVRPEPERPEAPRPAPPPRPDPLPETTPPREPLPPPAAADLIVPPDAGPLPEPAPPAHAALDGAPPEPAPRPAPRPPAAPVPVTFAGLEARPAASIVYIVDASGSMVSTLPFVRAELAASVSRLAPSQKFGVVVFRDDAAGVDRFAGELIDATDENKTRLGAWLASIEPAGRSDPLAGLGAALDLRPELAFLMTRSIRRSAGSQWGAGRDATLAALERLNRADARGRRPCAIKVIQFLDTDPTGLLPEIARRHGDGPGSYRVVTREELR